MDKKQAEERIAAIERESAGLRRIIEAPEEKPKTRYDWSKAPDWATIAVTNYDGDVCFGDYKQAEPNNTGGWTGSERGNMGWREGYSTEICPDWRDSLEHRPE